LVCGHLNDHRTLDDLAAEAGIYLHCAMKWLARYRSGGPASMADQGRVRRPQRRKLDSQALQHAIDCAISGSSCATSPD